MALTAPVYLDVEDDDTYMGSRFRYLGFVDAMDLTALALNSGLDTKPTGGVLDRLARWFMPDASEVVAAAVNLSHNDPYVSVFPGAKLSKVFEGMAHGYHRIAIESVDAGEIIGLVTQTQMIRLLAGHRHLLGRLADATLGELFTVDPRFKVNALLIRCRWLSDRVSPGLPCNAMCRRCIASQNCPLLRWPCAE